jgi:DNA-binding IclR family transcriptional regulator
MVTTEPASVTGRRRVEWESRVDRPSDLIQSVSRALRILEEVGRHPDGVAPKVVAARCELTPSTAYHLLRTLAYEGYLSRDPSGDYRLGLELADRYRDLAASLTRRPTTHNVLATLVRRTGLSAYLARFVDDRIAVVDVVEGTGSPHLEDLVPGFDEGAHATALGKALLSTLEPPARRAYLRAVGMRPFTPRTVREPDGLDHELETVTPTGWFVEESQYRPEVSCVARRVHRPDQPGRWYAVGVSASSPALRSRRCELTDAIADAADRLAESSLAGTA